MTGPRWRALRLLLWLTGLVAASLLAHAVVVGHQARTRGIAEGFLPPVGEADVPLLGVNVALEQYDDAALEATLARIARGGFVWVRQSFYWRQVEPQPGHYDWTASDRIVAAVARQAGLRLVAVLDDSPPELPADPDRFAAFAQAFAARYASQVDDYQVWDEPNLAERWGGQPVSPLAYADLLARTAQAVRGADPEARILLAGLAPTVETGPQNLSDARYLAQLYQAGAGPYFDIVAGKPYGFDTGPDDRRVGENVLNFSRLILLREVMLAYGDAHKAIWASHWGWNALPPGWAGRPSLWGQTDEATQAARTVAALARARAEWPWAGALILEHWQPPVALDDPHWGFSLMAPDGQPRPVNGAVAAWANGLPDGAPAGGYAAANPWATYEGSWRVGSLGADVGASGDRASFRFDGASVAATVRRGPYRAYLYVTLDGGPANGLPQDEAGRSYIALYDEAPALATVPLASGLAPGLHTVEVVAERGQGQWVLANWHVGGAPVRDGLGWKLAGLAAFGLLLEALLVCDARRLDWGALRRAFLGWPEWAQVALAGALAGILWAAAANWETNLIRIGGALEIAFHPWLCVALLALPALAWLFSLRPDLGLALVAFSAPFYLQPADLIYGALSMPEMLVALCAVGLGVRARAATRPEGRGAQGRRSRRGGGRAQLTALDGGVALLVLAAVVAGLAAPDWRAAAFELRTVFVFPALFYGLLRLASADARARWRVVSGWLLGAACMAAVGLGQYALGRGVTLAEGGLPRLRGVYYSPNSVGLYLGRVWPLLLAVTLWDGNRRRRIPGGVALVLVTLALGLSFSRGALLLGLPAPHLFNHTLPV